MSTTDFGNFMKKLVAGSDASVSYLEIVKCRTLIQVQNVLLAFREDFYISEIGCGKHNWRCQPKAQRLNLNVQWSSLQGLM